MANITKSKASIKREYISRRKEIKQEYIEANGSARGIKSDKRFKQTFTTQKRLLTYYENKKEADAIAKKKPEPPDTILIEPGAPYFEALRNDSDGGGAIFDVMEQEITMGSSGSYAIVDGRAAGFGLFTANTDAQFDQLCKDLYKHLLDQQNAAAKKAAFDKKAGKKPKPSKSFEMIEAVLTMFSSGKNVLTVSIV